MLSTVTLKLLNAAWALIAMEHGLRLFPAGEFTTFVISDAVNISLVQPPTKLINSVQFLLNSKF